MRTPAFRPLSIRRENGTTAIEFAIVAMVFLVIVLGIMEFGRALFLWNTVQEVTRRAAREAVVRNTNDAPGISRFAVFRPEGGTVTVALPAGGEITNFSVRINYLNANMANASPMPTDPADNISACNNASRATSCIRYVETCVATGNDCANSITYVPMVGLFPFLAIRIPVSRVVMPAESLGFNVAQ